MKPETEQLTEQLWKSQEQRGRRLYAWSTEKQESILLRRGTSTKVIPTSFP